MSTPRTDEVETANKFPASKEYYEIVVHARTLERELAAESEKAERYRLATLKLDGELATERARLDAGTILLTVAGERVWHCGVDLRTAIDAAMKEGA